MFSRTDQVFTDMLALVIIVGAVLVADITGKNVCSNTVCFMSGEKEQVV